MTVHIDAYGNASLGEESAGFSLEGSRLTLSDEPIRLSFAKADERGNALSGALFSVTGVFADGQATTLEGLDVSALSALHFVQGQTYALEETQAPTGYELISGSLRFVVGADGKVSLDGSGVSNGSYAVSADGVAITAVDEPIEAQVTKVSSADVTAQLLCRRLRHRRLLSRDWGGWRRAYSGRNTRGRQRVRAGGDRGPGRLRPR